MKKLIIALFVSANLITSAQVRLANVFSDHMVLQQQSEVMMWGWAGSGESILIKPSWSEDTIKIKSRNSADWSATLKTPVAGGPYKIYIKASNEYTE